MTEVCIVKIDQYAVIGNPIHHSKSPYIHQLFAQQCNQLLEYKPLLVELNNLEQALEDFQKQGGKGVNITLPFKTQAFELVDILSERAKRARAVNVIHYREDGSRFGDNTDGIGLVRDLLFNQKIPIQNKKILVLGAGGAVRGILAPLLDEKPEQVFIKNRTEAKARALAEVFSDLGPISAINDLKKEQFDIVINGTSASLQDKVLALPKGIVSKNACCYDMAYGKGMTPFLNWGKQEGAAFCLDGAGMLVEQAAESFYIWRSVRPETVEIIKKLTIIKIK